MRSVSQAERFRYACCSKKKENQQALREHYRGPSPKATAATASCTGVSTKEREEKKSSRRGVARLPLDGAADARLLRAVHRLAGKHGVDRGTQIAPGHGLVVARPAVVELPAIHQSPLRIKEKEVRRTGGLVTLGNILRLVETEGETEIEPFSHLFQS